MSILLTLLLQAIDATGEASEPSYSLGENLGYSILGIGFLFLYFLPAIAGRKKRNADAITLLNLFLGWTFLGWIVALVWATSKDAVPPRAVPLPAPPPVPASVADELLKLQGLREAGALTEAEFNDQKQRVLGPSVQQAISNAAASATDYQSQKQRALRHS